MRPLTKGNMYYVCEEDLDQSTVNTKQCLRVKVVPVPFLREAIQGLKEEQRIIKIPKDAIGEEDRGKFLKVVTIEQIEGWLGGILK